MAAIDEYFERFATFYFFEGIKRLEEHWAKCVEVEGDYVEKKKEFCIKKSFLYIFYFTY